MLIDTHTHLNDERFAGKIDDVLGRAAAAGVGCALVVGIDAATSAQAVELARDHESLFAVVGIQPNSLADTKPGEWEQILELAGGDRVVGIGESGLDWYWKVAPMPLQRDFFVRHLTLAAQLDRPIVIHCRDAQADTLDVLSRYCDQQGRPVVGVMHSFVGDTEMAHRCLELGLHLSFAGMVTFKKNQPLRDVAAEVPLDRLLIETDSPYLSPHPLRGKRNEPAHLVHTAACLAEVRGITPQELAAATTRNAIRVFRLPEGRYGDAGTRGRGDAEKE